MSKLVIIIGLITAFFILKHLINSSSSSKTIHNSQDKDSKDNKAKPESLDYADTAQCSFCGTHIPISSAYKSGDNFYCSEEHYKNDNS